MYEIGDRVEMVSTPDSRVPDGSKGTVVDTDFGVISVDWDKDISGHDCDGKARRGHGWNVHDSYIKKISKHKEGGEETMALNYGPIELTELQNKNLSEDAKTLVKAGVLDSELQVKDLGFVTAFLIDQNLAALAKAAKVELDKIEKARKATK